MQVYALVGASGTGKSHRATYLAFKYDIHLVIDDGLLIKDTTVLAGKSAKREATKIGAVKRAIFQDDAHAREVKDKIAESGEDKILILGTSEKMVNRIADRLNLPRPQHIIRIEDIASPRAIQKALSERKNKNSHVIPIPTFAIKKDFPGYLIDPLRSFWSKGTRDQKQVVIERSIVRPIYNLLGGFYISENVLIQITTHLVSQVEGVARVGKVDIKSQPDGVRLELEVNVFYGHNIPLLLGEIQRQVKHKLEFLSGLNLVSVQVTARKIELPENL